MSSTRPVPKRLRYPLYQDPAALRRKRVEAGLRQADLAERAQCSQNFISELESGHRSASAATMRNLACALGCTVTELMPPPSVTVSGSAA